MDREVAGHLIDELCNRVGLIISPDKNMFIDVLVSTNVPQSSRFNENILRKEQTIERSHSSTYLSLREVLRNKNAKYHQLSKWKNTYERIMSVLGIYSSFDLCSSEPLIRNLRASKDLIEMLGECEEPFSLLGLLETFCFDYPNETVFHVLKPLLVIPKLREIKSVTEWEELHTIYERSVYSRPFERISKKEYLGFLQ